MLSLRTTWPKKLILSNNSLPLLSLMWKKDHSVAQIQYFYVPDSKLCEMMSSGCPRSRWGPTSTC